MPLLLKEFLVSDPLKAISPIDGRYSKSTESLSDYFSEHALIRYRTKIEIEYLISLSLEKGINNISISTGIECQGLFQETYLNSYEVKYVPNPFKQELQLYIGGQDNIVEIGVYSSSGQLIDYQNISLPFGVRNYTLNTDKYKTGVYIINIKGETIDQSIQVIKK